MKENRIIPLIFTVVLLVLILSFTPTSALMGAEKKETIRGTQTTEKKITPEKKVIHKTHPGDVYPGDAAAAGYEETSVFGPRVRSYQVKDKFNRTYIFSEVRGHWPGDNYGYFRVLYYYGYGRDEEEKRDHLIFASKTPMPACKDPVKAECGNPLRDAGGYIALFMYGSQFAMYHPVVNYGSGGLSYLDAYVPEQDITDIDGNGNLDIKAFVRLKDTPIRLSVPITQVMAIYQYIEYDRNCGCSKFVKVKGRAYEKVYMEYVNKMKQEKKIIAWLAAVECTENPDLIRTAVDEFMNLPSMDQKEKQVILEMLINNGFGGLKINKKNP